MEVASLTAVIRADIAGFQSAVRLADNSLLDLQRRIEQVEKAASDLGASIGGNLAAVGEAAAASSAGAANATERLTTAVGQLEGIITKVVAAEAARVEEQQKQIAASEAIAEAAKAEAAAVVAAQGEEQAAVQATTLSYEEKSRVIAQGQQQMSTALATARAQFGDVINTQREAATMAEQYRIIAEESAGDFERESVALELMNKALAAAGSSAQGAAAGAEAAAAAARDQAEAAIAAAQAEAEHKAAVEAEAAAQRDQAAAAEQAKQEAAALAAETAALAEETARAQAAVEATSQRLLGFSTALANARGVLGDLVVTQRDAATMAEQFRILVVESAGDAERYAAALDLLNRSLLTAGTSASEATRNFSLQANAEKTATADLQRLLDETTIYNARIAQLQLEQAGLTAEDEKWLAADYLIQQAMVKRSALWEQILAVQTEAGQAALSEEERQLGALDKLVQKNFELAVQQKATQEGLAAGYRAQADALGAENENYALLITMAERAERAVAAMSGVSVKSIKQEIDAAQAFTNKLIATEAEVTALQTKLATFGATLDSPEALGTQGALNQAIAERDRLLKLVQADSEKAGGAAVSADQKAVAEANKLIAALEEERVLYESLGNLARSTTGTQQAAYIALQSQSQQRIQKAELALGLRQAPSEEKPIKSPFEKGAAAEIDSVAKSTRGAAGSFFNLGTAAAFASTSFLVGLFGGTALRTVIEASRGLATAQEVLGHTVQNVGGDWQAQQKAIEAYVSKTSEAAAFTETDLTGSLNKLVAATGSVKQGEYELSVATDLARAKNLDLATATRDVTLVGEGHASVLRRQGIVLPVVTAATDALKAKIAAASDAGIHFTAASKLAATQLAKQHDAAATAALGMVALANSVQGAAEAYKKSPQGGIDQFKVALDNVEVAIGNAILPSFNKLVQSLDKLAQGWLKSGAVTRGATEGVNLFKDAIETVAPIVADMFNAVRDGISALGGLKVALEVLAGSWLAKFVIMEHPVLTLIIAIDQLLQHVQGLKGVIGPLAAVAGGAFLAIQIGADAAIAKFLVFFGLLPKGETQFKSLTEIIVGGMTAASAAIQTTAVEMGILTKETQAAATAAGALDVAQAAERVTGGGVILPGAAGAGLAAGEGEAVGGGLLAGLAEVPFGPIALGLGVVAGGLAYLFTQETKVQTATDSARKSLESLDAATQSIPALKLANDQALQAVATDRLALSTTKAAKGTLDYKTQVDAYNAAVQEQKATQDALNKAEGTRATGLSQTTGKLLNINSVLLQNSINSIHAATSMHKLGSELSSVNTLGLSSIQSLNAPTAKSVFSTWLADLQQIANQEQNKNNPLAQHQIDLVKQLALAIGHIPTPKEVDIILAHSNLATQLKQIIDLLPAQVQADLIGVGTTMGQVLAASVTNSFAQKFSGSLDPFLKLQLPPGTNAGGSGSGPGGRNNFMDPAAVAFKELPANIQTAINEAQNAVAHADTKKNLDALKAAIQAAVNYTGDTKFTKGTQAAALAENTAEQEALNALNASSGSLVVKPPKGTTPGGALGAAAANRLAQAQAAAAQAGNPSASTGYDPNVLNAQKKLETVIQATIGVANRKLNEVSATSKQGVALNKELVTLQRESNAALKKIATEESYKAAAAAHKRIDSILGINANNPGAISAGRAREQERTALLAILKKEGGKAGLGAFGANVGSESLKQLIALIKHQPGVPKSTITSLDKINQSINIASEKHIKLTAEESQNIQARLKEIATTLERNKYQSNYVVPSAHNLTAGLGLTRTQRIAEEARISQFEGHGGKVPSNLAAAGIPLPTIVNEGSGSVVAPAPHYKRYPGPHQTIHIDNVNINDKNVWSIKKLQSEILGVANRNSTQTKGANAGKRPA